MPQPSRPPSRPPPNPPPQALAALSSGLLPSAVYGTEHLLRLFVKLPELLAAAGAGGMAEEALLQTANAVQVGWRGGGQWRGLG